MPNFIKQILTGSARAENPQDPSPQHQQTKPECGAMSGHDPSHDLEPTIEIPRPVFDKPTGVEKTQTSPHSAGFSLRLDDPTVEMQMLR